MIITLESTVVELLNSKVISVRTSNICASNELYTVADIHNYKLSHGSFLRLRNCGLKSNTELMAVLQSLSIGPESEPEPLSLLETMPSSFQQIFIDEYELLICDPNEPSDIVEAFKHLFPTHYYLFDKISETAFSLHDSCFEQIEDKRIRYLIQKKLVYLVNEIAKQISKRMEGIEDSLIDEHFLVIICNAKALTTNLEKDFVKEYYKYCISEAKQNFLAAAYENLLTDVSGHALAFKKAYFLQFYDLIPFLDYDFDTFLRQFWGKKKSAADFFSKILAPFKVRFNEVITSDASDESFYFALRFPTLKEHDIDFVTQFLRTHDYIPLFYIIHNALTSLTSREFDIFGLRYGFNTLQNTLTLSSIAAKHDISSERVRQILRKFSLKDALNLKDEDAIGYIHNLDFLLETSKFFKSISEQENVALSFEAFCRVLSEFVPVVYVDKYPIQYLVHKKLAPTIDKIFSVLTELSAAQYAEDSQFSIMELFPKAFYDNVETINLITTIADALNIPFSNQTFFFNQNHIDVEKEAYQLLYATGEPISAEAIHSYLLDKYPSEYKLAFVSLKQKLLSSERIQCVGKTSTYKLSHWRNVYGGSIRDLLRKLLQESDVPLSLDYLTSIVTNSFDTNRKNIHANLASSDQFTTFVGNLYGLADKSYPDEYTPFDVSKTRASFDERFEQFKQFVEDFNRLPYSSGVEEEESLTRWRSNVMKRILEVTDEQVQALTKFVDSKSHLPSTGIEAKFKRTCSEYLNFVTNNYELPTYKTNPHLSSWFYKSKNKFQEYTDNRKSFFENLLNELRGFGFC